jgi:hypothetical protein
MNKNSLSDSVSLITRNNDNCNSQLITFGQLIKGYMLQMTKNLIFESYLSIKNNNDKEL